ncbi:MAG: hypothetical protein E6K94_00330 [Thaumarchaeota archaeon]|nr:MAG: hypothetical protein E6L01_02245 [Nitrososphaerota archaeon]TLX92246.1 MAG: hypothetical protein E6K94_00330 [Nitrososphaerota archaeon]
MINYSTLAIPIIIILVVGGVSSFLLVYSFYPEKHENVNIDGKCYELIGQAHQEFMNLSANKEIKTLILQLSKVEPNDVSIPIIFDGGDSEIKNFIDRFHLVVTSYQKVKYYPNIDGLVVVANIAKTDLESIVSNLTYFDVNPSAKTVAGSIGVEPNKYITLEELKDVSARLTEFMDNGIREIIAKSEGVKSAECRNNMYVGQ